MTLINNFKFYFKANTIKNKNDIVIKSKINNFKFIEIGKNNRIGNHFKVSFFKEFYSKTYYPKLLIGSNCYMGDYITILCTDNVIIGNDVLIASHVLITSENHGIDPESPIPYSKQ